MNYVLYLTENCNLRCKYCYEKNKTSNEINFETIKSIIDYEINQNNKTSLINFYGGEPLLKKDLIYKTIDYIKSKRCKTKFNFGITTNGILLDDEFIKYMKKNKFIHLAYSIDGNKDVQNKNRVLIDGKDTFDIVKKNARQALKSLKNVVAMVTVTKNTLQDLSDSVEYLINLGFKTINLQFDYTADWNDEDLDKIENEYRKVSDIYYKNIIKKNPISILIFDNKIRTYIDNSYECNKECSLGMETLYVATDGNLYPCVHFVGNSKFIIGTSKDGVDIKKQNLLIQSAFKENSTCMQCAIRNRCKHTCCCKNYITMHDINKVSPIICQTEKIFIKISDEMAENLYTNYPKIFVRKFYTNV